MQENELNEFWLPGKDNNIFSPRTDFAFKKVFGNLNNKDIVSDFLKTMTILNMPHQEYSDLEFSDTFLNKERKGGKYSILDLVITTKNGHKIDLEMQNRKYTHFEKRIDYYVSRCASKQLDGSADYNKLCRSIVIFILGHKYFLKNQDPLSRWLLRNDYGDLLGSTLEVYILELPKVSKKHEENPLYDWVDFFNVKTESDLDKCATKSKTIKKAVGILKEISADKETQLSYEAWIRDIRMRNCAYDTGKQDGIKEGIKEGLEKGIKKGIKEGIKEGLEKGIKEGEAKGEAKKTIENAIAFAKTGMSLKLIFQTLNITQDVQRVVIEKLKKGGIKYSE